MENGFDLLTSSLVSFLREFIGDQSGESVFRYLVTHVKSILTLKIITAAFTKRINKINNGSYYNRA